MPDRSPLPMIPTVPLGSSKPTAHSFCAWLGGAIPGESFEYHQGFLAIDREPPEDEKRTPEHARIDSLAACVLDYSGHGMVALVQRRLGRRRFSYLALRIVPRRAS